MAEDKQEIKDKLKEKVAKTFRFVKEKLRGKVDINQNLLNEYENLLGNFSEIDIDEFLQKLAQIRNRPVPEGSKADFIEADSFEFEGEHKNLMEYLNEIEDLVIEARKV